MQVSHSAKLELLRHGPSHNQLLSPLTQYLALSGRHEAVTVHVPYEHQEFLILLTALRYQEKHTPTQRSQLKQMASVVSKILGSVPGLIADLSACGDCEEGLTHLRLVFSASELALLPFEMSNAPSGFPGEGQPLSLQLEVPIAMTREVRGAGGHCLNWDRKPKILFAAAAPGLNPIPFDAHLLALRKALAPWLRPLEAGQSAAERLSEYLKVIPNARLCDIQEACARESFSHIHILAHGAPCGSQSNTRFGLLLFGSPGGRSDIDVVNGERLANAIRGHRAGLKDELSEPLVVTVASCDSGQQGSVIWPGSSLAQDLHEAGVPFVVASQFPLTKKGSVRMVDVLYKSLLWGKDPRVCLHELRQKLATMDQDTHDWASVVAYASLPADLRSQLRGLKTKRAKSAVRVALAQAYHLTERLYAQYPSRSIDSGSRNTNDKAFEKAVEEIERAIAWVPASGPDADSEARIHLEERAQIIAPLGSAEKRKAQALAFRAEGLIEEAWELEATNSESGKEKIETLRQKSKELQDRSDRALEAAEGFYKRAFDLDARYHWPAVQYLGIKAFRDVRLRNSFELNTTVWCQAHMAAEADLAEADYSKRAWAHGSLAELYFLAVETPAQAIQIPSKTLADAECVFSDLAVRHAKELVALVGRKSFEAQSTFWQFSRYEKWMILGDSFGDVATRVRKVLMAEDE